LHGSNNNFQKPVNDSMTLKQLCDMFTKHQFFKVKADSSLSYQEGKAEFKKIIERIPMFMEVYMELNEWDKAIEINPDYIDAYRYRGDRYLVKGQYDKAISDYNNVIRLNPEDAEYYSSRGSAYYIKGLSYFFGKKSNYHNAIIDFSKAIELGPNMGDDEDYKYHSRGVSYTQIGRFEEAIADLSKVIELKSRDAAAYYLRGFAYAETGEYEKAIADYNKVLEMYPGSKDAYKYRGDVYNKTGNLEQACSDWKKACSRGLGNCKGWSIINRIRCLGK